MDNDQKKALELQAAVLGRLKKHLNVAHDKDIAAILDLKPSNYNGLKNRGSLTGRIATWAIDQHIDLNYLLTGKPWPPDRAQLEWSIMHVSQWLQTHNATLAPAEYAASVADIYDFISDIEPETRQHKVDRFLELVVSRRAAR